MHLILKRGGELEKEYEKYSTVYNIDTSYITLDKQKELINYLCDTLEIKKAICNTVVSGDFSKILNGKGVKVITLVHELPGIIKSMSLENNANLLVNNSYKVVFPSEYVKEKFRIIAEIGDKKAIILPQGTAKHCKYKYNKKNAAILIRDELKLNKDVKIVLNVGYGDVRKGIDLFVEIANQVANKCKNIYFVWVGNLHPDFEKNKSSYFTNTNLLFISNRDDVSAYFAGSDLFMLTSREDPFPSVVLEAMNNGLPVIGFDDAGGFKDVVDDSTGVLVNFCDVYAMSQEIISLIGDNVRMQKLSNNAMNLIEEKFNFASYVYQLLDLLGDHYEKISVVVPNYNYEKYLPMRIKSILDQNYPIYELVFLDDASNDNSVNVIENYLSEELNIKLIKNNINSSNVFKQWVTGIASSRGNYIWIAEADDQSEKTFLEKIMNSFDKDKALVLVYSQSKQIDSAGDIIGENYLEYTNDIDKEKWKEEYINDGIAEISDALAIKNTIPNVSAVVFKRPNLNGFSTLNKISNYKVGGDWCFYVSILEQGKIGFIPEALNYHRRHLQGITISCDAKLHYDEIVDMQDYITKNFTVSKETLTKIANYRKYLIKYFNLSDYVV